MASITRAEALLLSHANVLGAYLKTNESDQLLGRIPRIGVRGDSLQATDVETLASAPCTGSGGTADATATAYASPARSHAVRRIATKVEVNADIAQNVSMINDVFDEQIQAKMVAMWRTVGTKLIYGDDTDPDPMGLQSMAALHPDGVGNLGGALTLAAVAEMTKHVRPWDASTPRAFVMNRGQYVKLLAAAWASGFNLEVCPDPILAQPLVHFLGVPVLISDFITDTEPTNKTSIYHLILGPRNGEPQHGGLVWFYNEDMGPGIRRDGPHRNSGTADTLFATLDLNFGFAALSLGSVYRLSNITP